MSKNDRLGPMLRAMVGVDVEYHGVLADIINRLNSRDALAWSGLYAGVSMAGLPKVEPVAPPPLLSVIATTQLAAIAGKKTARCFVGERWASRDGDFYNWLQASQPDADACAMAALTTSRGWLFVEAATSLPGVGTDTDIVRLGNRLIELRYTTTLPQAEAMTEATDRGEPTGMRTDGYGNFFFVETGDSKNPVSVGSAYRGGRGWVAFVSRLGVGYRWSAGSVLLVRNLSDTLAL